jgi:hypothetical protein
LVGGISGLEYDDANDVWYFLSDDRSDNAPARFYTGNIALDESAISEVAIESEHTLLQENGEPYPNGDAGGNVPDTESIRIDLQSGDVWYTSEGGYDLDVDPFVATATVDGAFISTLPLPERYQMSGGEELGPRDNQVFEGMTFSADGESVWVAMEGPLFQDGPESSATNEAVTRMVNLDRDGNVLKEIAFVLNRVDAPEGAQSATSGVTEILAVDDSTLVVVERASVQDAEGVFSNEVRVWQIDVDAASDVSQIESLIDADYDPAPKTLVIDLNDNGVDPTDNIESITWGPVLPNGNQTLILNSDNNFNPETQVQLFVALEVVGGLGE